MKYELDWTEVTVTEMSPEACCENLRRAIEDKGQRPDVHDAIMRRHRAEWPTLWTAIDALLAQGHTPPPTPMPTDPPMFLYRVVDKNREGSDVAYVDRADAVSELGHFNKWYSENGPFTIQRTQVHWEDVPE